MYFPEGWNGFNYWMAMTPYPNSQDHYENPSIVVSNDNINWTAPVKNPLDQTPSGSHNSDTEWIFAPDEDMVHLLYRKGDWELFVLTSPNGIGWDQKPVQIFDGYKSNCCLSPTVVREDKDSYRMWMVNGRGSPNTLMTYVKEGSPNGPWTYKENCTIVNQPEGRDLWHIDVISCAGGKFYLALIVLADMDKTINTTLHLGLSSDGVIWTMSEREVISASKSSWDNDMIYRSSSAVIEGEGKERLGIWYSARSSSGRWHIGYAEMGINITWIAQRNIPSEKPPYLPDNAPPRSYYNGRTFSDTMNDRTNGSVPEPAKENPASKAAKDDLPKNGSGIVMPDLPEPGDPPTIVPDPDVNADDTGHSDSKGIPADQSQGDTQYNDTEDPMDIVSPENVDDPDEAPVPNEGNGAPQKAIDGGKSGFPFSSVLLLTMFLSLISLTGLSTGQLRKRSFQCR